MQIRFAFVMHPVDDVSSALSVYLRLLPEADAWWPDQRTVLLTPPPGSGVPVMLEEDATERTLGPGAVFLVDDVARSYARHRSEWSFAILPCEIPPGRYAACVDRWCNPVRVFDLTNPDFSEGWRFQT